jgi:hypothetical protein
MVAGTDRHFWIDTNGIPCSITAFGDLFGLYIDFLSPDTSIIRIWQYLLYAFTLWRIPIQFIIDMYESKIIKDNRGKLTNDLPSVGGDRITNCRALGIFCLPIPYKRYIDPTWS